MTDHLILCPNCGAEPETLFEIDRNDFSFETHASELLVGKVICPRCGMYAKKTKRVLRASFGDILEVMEAVRQKWNTE